MKFKSCLIGLRNLPERNEMIDARPVKGRDDFDVQFTESLTALASVMLTDVKVDQADKSLHGLIANLMELRAELSAGNDIHDVFDFQRFIESAWLGMFRVVDSSLPEEHRMSKSLVDGIHRVTKRELDETVIRLMESDEEFANRAQEAWKKFAASDDSENVFEK